MNKLQQEELNILIEFDRICKKHNIIYSLSSGTLLGAIRHQGFIPWDDDIDVNMSRSEFNRFEQVVAEELNQDFFYQSFKTEKDHYHAFSKIRSNKVELVEKSTDYLNINHGVWIDIFPYDNIPDDLELRNEQKKKVSFYNKLISLFVYTFVTDEDLGKKRLIKSTFYHLNRIFYRVNFLLPTLYKKRQVWIEKYNNDKTEYANMLVFNFNDAIYQATFIRNAILDSVTAGVFENHQFLIPTEYDEILTLNYGDYMQLPPESERVSNHEVVLKDHRNAS
ncbi:LicD family protein [Erysipelothrix rhusiopathiae]|uniref:LicD family protein n=1 Tax=unclassified Erysipelothrix TaxID=2624170 RepID=UPI00137709E2|nr:LicD family protein [Erysipelothrix sp. strain 2 (EsS2-7-Brazil)]MBK2403373.1 LicD family protein [Erysipelothrix sp. strain 2 (EsS2-7-Brazil)]NBA00659.1 LicD family protein [Erysipelothrix rhusiopathiae]